jgi:hypothetical protein
MRFVRHRLDPQADPRRQHAAFDSACDLEGRRLGVTVFFGVGPVAVAILEVDAIVLDRLTAQARDDTFANRGGDVTKTECARESRRIGRVLVQRRERQRPKARGSVSAEQVGAAVKGVYGLRMN